MTTPSGESPLEDRQEVKSDQAASTRRLNVGVGLSIVVVLGLVLVSGCGLVPPAKVKVTAEWIVVEKILDNCEQPITAPPSGVRVFSTAVLKDGSGEILGKKIMPFAKRDSGFGIVTCTRTVVFDDVPADRDFYTFEVGNREIRKSRAALESNGWKFTGGDI